VTAPHAAAGDPAAGDPAAAMAPTSEGARSAGPAERRVHAGRRARREEDPRVRVSRALGLVPTTQDVVERWLDEALPAEGGAAALDAGCGRLSLLRPFRARLGRFVGVDIHAPAKPLQWLDEFAVADLCTDRDAFPDGTFDVALSNFTVEHFADPVAAFRTIGGWLKPGGWLVITTVNRRHPFVDLYLSIPTGVRSRVQPVVKKSQADAHPLVGACNTPRLIRDGLAAAGYADIEIRTTSHLARAWGHTLPTWGLGLLGDLAAHRMPARRSTIVARARRVAS
jgi:SAM-dependent methyltransferase